MGSAVKDSHADVQPGDMQVGSFLTNTFCYFACVQNRVLKVSSACVAENLVFTMRQVACKAVISAVSPIALWCENTRNVMNLQQCKGTQRFNSFIEACRSVQYLFCQQACLCPLKSVTKNSILSDPVNSFFGMACSTALSMQRILACT